MTSEPEHTPIRRVTVRVVDYPSTLIPRDLSIRDLHRLGAAARWAVETVFGVECFGPEPDDRDDDMLFTRVTGGYIVSVPINAVHPSDGRPHRVRGDWGERNHD